MNKRKIIIIAYHMGRVGSSALMGLLNISGINTGGKKSLSGASPMNPKGFFEIKKQELFLRSIYPDYYPHIVAPPSLDNIYSVAEKYYQKYLEIIENEFSDKFPIAIKSQRTLTIPFLKFLKDKFDIKIVLLNRNNNDQIKSIMRVWGKYGDDFQKNSSFEYILNWLKKWKEFSEQNILYSGLSSYNFNFEDLFNNTINNVNKLFEFLEEKPPLLNEIDSWLDRKLVNRIAFE